MLFEAVQLTGCLPVNQPGDPSVRGTNDLGWKPVRPEGADKHLLEGQVDPNPSSTARLSPARRFSTGALKWTLKALRPRWEST